LIVEPILNTAATKSTLIDLESWIERARLGDKQALGHALSMCRDYLLLVANDRLKPELQAKGNPSDQVQETFLKALRGIEGFRGRTASEWRLWLRGILVRNMAKERRRFAATAKRQIQCEVMIPETSELGQLGTNETPSRVFARRELEAALLEALDRLPVHYGQVVVWHHREHHTFEEIGQRLGISAEAARKLWKRALICLRKELGPTYDSR
jgi:RNA polymerase sigma-70 factor (subfamily 1)